MKTFGIGIAIGFYALPLLAGNDSSFPGKGKTYQYTIELTPPELDVAIDAAATHKRIFLETFDTEVVSHVIEAHPTAVEMKTEDGVSILGYLRPE